MDLEGKFQAINMNRIPSADLGHLGGITDMLTYKKQKYTKFGMILKVFLVIT